MSGERPALSVVVAGGGTAGHIEPALAVADAVRALVPDARITALGTERGLETTLVPRRGYPLELIPPVPLPRKPTMDLLKLPGRVVSSVRRTRQILDEVDADVVVGFGGYVALPAYLAAGAGPLRRRRRIPVVVHEANAGAGIANRIGALRAERVLAAVPRRKQPNVAAVAPGREDLAVRRKGEAVDRAAAPEGEDFLAARQLEELTVSRRAIDVARDGDGPPVRREGEVEGLGPYGHLHPADLPAALWVPEADGVVLTGRDQCLAVGPEGHVGDVRPVPPAGRAQAGQGAGRQRVAVLVGGRRGLDLGSRFGGRRRSFPQQACITPRSTHAVHRVRTARPGNGSAPKATGDARVKSPGSACR